MTDLLSGLPADLPDIDEDRQALANMPMLADRLIYHTKRLRAVQYVTGAEGVRAYKAKFPEAKGIQTRATTIAFQPKPKGYSDFLCNLLDRWFRCDVALADTNKADVERLNRAMHPRTFNPANHFSKPLSGSLLGKLADVFDKHGSHLDTSKPLSMAKVRAAVKAAKGQRSTGKPFGGIGHITGDQLTIGNQVFRIEEHHGHASIRVMVGSSRVRLRLDALVEFMGLVGFGRVSLPQSSIENRIGELAPDAENASETDPLNDVLPENWPRTPEQSSLSLTGELAPEPSGLPSLSERLAALKAAQQPQSVACVNAGDPLNL